MPSIVSFMAGSPSSPAFGVAQPITGTSPTATTASDVLTFSSSDGSVGILGSSSTNVLDFSVVGSNIGGFTPGSILYASSTGKITEKNAQAFFDDTNNVFGFGTNTPEPLATQTWKKTVGPLPTNTTPTAVDAGAYGSNYNSADSVSYFIVGYFTVDGILYYMSPSVPAGLSITNTGDAVQIDWPAINAEGYIVVRDFNGDSFGSYFDVGNVTSMLDDNGNSFTWIVAPYPTTPTTIEFLLYGNIFDTSTFPYTYFSMVGDDGYFRTGAATLTGYLGIGNQLPTHPLYVDNAITENNTATAIIIKDNAGLGTGNDIEFGRCALVIHNPNGASQTMLAFSTGSISSPTLLGGLRVDHNGTYSWEALSTAGHYFFVGGLGTEHIAGFFSINGSANAYGLTVGSTTAPSGSNVLDVYGPTNLRGDLTVSTKNIVTDTTTGTKIGTATTQKLAFYNSTPIVQPGATVDLGTVISNLGLRAAGTAYPITTSGAVALTGGLTISTADLTITDRNIVLSATTGTKIGTATTQKLSFFNSAPVVQQTDGAALTNNVTSGGTTNTIANYTDLTTYANDAAAIRNNIFQLAKKLKIVDDALRLYGLLS